MESESTLPYSQAVLNLITMRKFCIAIDGMP